MTFSSFPISGNIYLLAYGIALFLSFTLTFFLIRLTSESKTVANLLHKWNLFEERGIGPFGGVAVILSFILTLWVFIAVGLVDRGNTNLYLVLTLGTGLMFLLGIIDDIYNCRPRIKLIFQIAIAVILYFSGFQIERIGDFIELRQFSILLTILWIVGITNSLNLIDGMDGLASGIVFFSCLTLIFIYMDREIIEASFLAVILAGSVLGFFFFNLPPARIILGDTGSLPLGLLIALITLLPLNQGYTDEIYYIIPVVTLLIPIMDTTFSFFRRLFKGISPFSKDAEHFHHRLQKLGLSSSKAIWLLFGIGFYFDMTAMVPSFHITLILHFIPIYFIFIILNIIFLIYLLHRSEKKHKFRFSSERIS